MQKITRFVMTASLAFAPAGPVSLPVTFTRSVK